MEHVDALRDTIPDAAKDLRLNLQSVLRGGALKDEQVWGSALASAFFLKDKRLADALVADAKAAAIPDAVIEDAQAAAAIMGMTTVYYRFRHLVGKESYAQRPARLRMQRMATPATTKVNFELFSLACAALAGCEMCIRSHEANLVKEGVSEDGVHDAVRIASVVSGASVALAL